MKRDGELLKVTAIERGGERIVSEQDLIRIQAHLLDGGAAIIRGLITEHEAFHVRRACLDWANRESVSNPSITVNSRNFHRVDYNPEKSKVKCIMHGFSFFYWDRASDIVSGYFRRLFRVRNVLSDLAMDYALENMRDGMISRPIVQHYPRGGGYMQEHIDPDRGQKVVLSTVLSAFNADFFSGGLYYRNSEGNKVHVDPLLHVGDTFLFHPRLSHGVDPIDSDVKLDWDRPDGRWMMFSTLVSLASLNGIAQNATGTISDY